MSFSNWTQKQKEASDALIRRGNYRHIFLGVQKKLYDTYVAGQEREIGYYASRKSGKTMSMYLLAAFICNKTPNVIVRFILPQLKTARDVIYPMVRELTDVFPEDLRPTLLKSEATIQFPNGSQIRLGGASKENCEASRGPIAHALFLDEVAAYEADNYDYLLYSILYPQLTTTNGPIFYSTTPPKNANHPFIIKHYPKLLKKGSLITSNIWDSPILTEPQKQEIVELYGGIDNENFRREYLCELITDKNLLLVPEFSDDIVFSEPWPTRDEFGLPTKYRAYSSIDMGGTVDDTAILCGFYDHTRSKLVVESEWFGLHSNLGTVVDNYHKIRENINTFEDTTNSEVITIDTFDIAAKELRYTYDMPNFIRPKKTQIVDAINYLRTAIENDRLAINSSCVRLIHQLQTAVWDEGKDKIARNANQSHADGIMALVYMLRSVIWNQRPNRLKLGLRS